MPAFLAAERRFQIFLLSPSVSFQTDISVFQIWLKLANGFKCFLSDRHMQRYTEQFHNADFFRRLTELTGGDTLVLL